VAGAEVVLGALVPSVPGDVDGSACGLSVHGGAGTGVEGLTVRTGTVDVGSGSGDEESLPQAATNRHENAASGASKKRTSASSPRCE
jgi:hypothetical protein